MTGTWSSCTSNLDGFVKSPSAGLRFTFRHCGVLLCTPHSSRFARLVPPVAGELFALPSTLATFCAAISPGMQRIGSLSTAAIEFLAFTGSRNYESHPVGAAFAFADSLKRPKGVVWILLSLEGRRGGKTRSGRAWMILAHPPCTLFTSGVPPQGEPCTLPRVGSPGYEKICPWGYQRSLGGSGLIPGEQSRHGRSSPGGTA